MKNKNNLIKKGLKDNLAIKGLITAIWIDRDGNITKRDKVENIVCYAGVEAMFKKLADEHAGNLKMNIAALGTGEDTATVNDTQLQTETYRNDVASSTAAANVLYTDAFFTADEVDGTFKEFGFLIDENVLWNRVNVDWTKSNVESLYVSGKWTLTNQT